MFVRPCIFDAYSTGLRGADMSKTLKEAALTTRAARARLAPGLHWRGLDAETHLGYRRGQHGGRWLVRWRVGKGYQQTPLARADDAFDADGSEVLDYRQACLAAKEHVASARQEAKALASGPALTVKSAIDVYLAMREARGKNDARSKLATHVMSKPVADMLLYRVTDHDLSAWREALPADLSPATVVRVVNDFKAALNLAARQHRSRLPAEFPGHVKAGLAAVEARPTEARRQILSDADVRRLIDAAWTIDRQRNLDGDLGRLILVLAATGARYSQVVRLTVADLQAKENRIMIPVSLKGRGVKAQSRIAFALGADVIEALKPAYAGRIGTEPLLERWRHIQTSPTTWRRDSRGPWKATAELTTFWREIIEEAGLPADVVPYSLRHSSIVRGLRSALPVRLVAALHDTSAAMIEKHYSAHIADAMQELSARAIVPLTTAPATVVAIPKAKTA
jgi:integrase